MSEYDGSVRIKTELDSKGLSSQLLSLENRIAKTADRIGSLRSKMDSLKNVKIPTDEYSKLTESMNEQISKLQELREYKQEYFGKGLLNDNQIKSIDNQIGLIEGKIKTLANEMYRLDSSGKAFTLGSSTEEYAKLGQEFGYAQSELVALNKRHDELIAKQHKTTNGYKKLGNIAKRVIEKIGKSTKKSNGLLSTMTSRFKGLALSLLVFNQISKVFNAMTSAIKEGFGNLYKDSEKFKKSVDGLKASATTLKNSFASAFSPIVEIAIPYIQKLMDYISELLGMVAQFTAAITGQKTYTKAIKQTTAAIEDETKASGKQLSGLDKLNNLSSQQGSDAAGGTMFEEVPVSDRFSNMADWMKSMWEDADFTELGTTLGSKIKNALDGIDWSPIKTKAQNIGKSIATLINGFVEVKGFGESIGKSIAEAINTGIAGINSFLDNTNWGSVGTFIGDSLNGLANTIDWEGIGHLFAQKFNAIFSIIGEAARTFDWGKFGLEIANGINTFISDFDWAENGARFGDLAKGLLDTIIFFLENTDWKELGDKIAEFIVNIDWIGIVDKIARGTSDILSGLLDLIIGFVENIDWGSVASGLWDALVGIVTNIDWSGLISKAFELLGAVISGSYSLIDGSMQLLEDLLESAFENIKSYFTTYINEAGGDIVQGLLNGITDALINIGNWILDHIFRPFMEGFKSAFGIHSPSTVMAEMGTYIIEGLLNGINSLVNNVTEIWNYMKNVALDVWNSVKMSISSIVQNIRNAITASLNVIKSIWTSTWTNLKTTVVNIFNGIWTSIKGVINKILCGVENMANGIINGINAAIGALNGLSFTIPATKWTDEMSIGLNIPTLDNISIPKLATGTVVPPNKEFMAVLGDNKTEPEVVSPLSTMKQALKEALLESGISGSNNDSGDIVIQIEGREVFRVVRKQAQQFKKQNGKPAFQ